MKHVRIEQARPGMVLAADLYVNGRLLLRSGCVLTDRHLDRLSEMGVGAFYVKVPDEEEGADGSPANLSERTRDKARRALERYISRLSLGIPIRGHRVRGAVNAIIEEVLANPSVLPRLSDLRDLQDYVFDHSVGVCTLSVFLGIHAGLTMPELRAMAMGAILHDAGKLGIPEPVWLKPGPLSDAEYRLIQRHTEIGYQMLRQQGDLDVRCAHVAYQHHERWDGSGYPRGLAGEQIHRFARIVALADVFDALTSDRPYRAAWPWHEAIRYLEQQAGVGFDPQLVRTFLARVAPYPVGSVVRLNTGEQARVIRLNERTPARPVVTILERPDREIDLAMDMARRIVGPV